MREIVPGVRIPLSPQNYALQADAFVSFVLRATLEDMTSKWFVYVLKSKNTNFRYIGSTNNLERRFNEHNDGKSLSTKHYAPFLMETFICVNTEAKARKLEKYFKTGSGRAILRKRILMIDHF